MVLKCYVWAKTNVCNFTAFYSLCFININMVSMYIMTLQYPYMHVKRVFVPYASLCSCVVCRKRTLNK